MSDDRITHATSHTTSKDVDINWERGGTVSEQGAPQQNGCQCGMCFFLAMEGSKYCVAHRGIMEAFDRKRAASLPESQPSPSGDYEKLVNEFWAEWDDSAGVMRNPEMFKKFLADWLRSHDAKVRAALQESPSGR